MSGKKLTYLIIASLTTLIFFMAGCAPQEHEVEGQAELEEAGEMINVSIVNYKTAYLQGDLEEAKEYLESNEILGNALGKEELKDEITPTAIPEPAVDTIKPTIVDSYLEEIKHLVEVIKIDDDITVVELELEYLDHEEFEQLFANKSQEALDEAVVEKTKWENILFDAMEEAPRSSYQIELELTKEEGSWKLSENPIPQEMYPYELSDSISLAHNYVTGKENIADKVEVIENSLCEAGLENYLPLSDSENYEQFIQDLNGVMIDMEITKERNFSIGAINLLEVAEQRVEIDEPQLFDSILDMEKEKVQIVYEGEKITTTGDIIKEWKYYFDEHIDEERRSGLKDFYGDEIRQGGRLGKLDFHDDLISFTLAWGGCVNIASAVCYINTEKDEIIVANFFHGSVSDREELSKWSPYGNYHVYQVRCPGKGDVELKVTDLNDYTNIEIDQPEIWGNIQEATWSDGSNKLYFKEEQEEKTAVIYWELNIPNRKIVKNE